MKLQEFLTKLKDDGLSHAESDNPEIEFYTVDGHLLRLVEIYTPEQTGEQDLVCIDFERT